jgi:hypothetical protein
MFTVIQQEDESPSPVLAPKLKDECKCEPQENNPAKLTTTGLAIYTPDAPSSNRKRGSVGDDSKTSNGAALKKPKIEPVCLLFYFHAEHVKFKVYNPITVSSH